MQRLTRSSAFCRLDFNLAERIVDQDGLKEAILNVLQVLKACDIQVFKGHPLASYIIVADHETHHAVYSSASNIGFMLKHSSAYTPSFCGARGSEWIIVDAQDVIVDLFTKEARQRYNLEELLHEKALRVL